MLQDTTQWFASMVIHALLLGMLLSLHVEPKTETRVLQIDGTVTEEQKPEEFLDLANEVDLENSLVPNVSLTAASLEPVKTAKGDLNPMESDSRSLANAAQRDRGLLRPLANASSKMRLGGNVDGITGVQVNAGGGGDAGSVDRISLEILRQLEKGKVLVVWVMDASGSLRQRRDQVIKRFDKVYAELGVLDKSANDAILTAVVAYGERTTFMTPRPTADLENLKKAVRDIKPDESGVENVFSAIKETALKWRSYQTNGRRKLMIVVLTDEIGDDPALLDDTVALVKRNRVPVYVLGPMAPFGRKEILVNWTDPPSGLVFQIPVERGPETVQSEHLSLPYWYNGPQYDLFPSGFGPYGLTRVAMESGGIYFLFDDGNIPGPKFNVYDLLEYTPNYQPYTEYARMMGQNPLRSAVIKAAQESKGAVGTPQTRFLAENINPALTTAQQTAATTLHFVTRAVENLRAVEKYRGKETSKRWQAHFDLMMGRLLATKVRCDEYNWILSQMKTNPKVPKGKDNNAWELVGDKKISYGQKEGGPDAKKAETNVRKSDPKATAKAKEDAEAALFYLQRVLNEHPGTPWAMMAERELTVPLGFQWRETYIDPPPKPGETPTKKQQQNLELMKKRAEAVKRVPKL